ncbi:alpha-1,6-mannosyl-glycoprotein 2-beta-N-acetylglucosaminyltransferase [Manduca sexta]|uniref:alpha-1,6-mannosyl-glycoprotein 2-beta-N-acetylglucosaminyltransferase n=1 Tax=Manduca sexta TaxID=7130 RepID=UPI001183F22D|nr:alpha-1,6-mannosyl-glycoprotein 2-beta-N-acetylglucosaminyltransferase [Manduca sexta]
MIPYEGGSRRPSAGLVPENLRQYLRFNEKHTIGGELTDSEVDRLRVQVEILNTERRVYNEKRFGRVLPETTTIVVQAHRDVERLQYLIVSLGQVRYIEDAVLVFSHSYYHPEINSLVRNITFCKVLQVFFPYSLQLHPHQFPGADPNDCSNSSNALCGKLNNERNARDAERKQHWWWTANLIFEHASWSYTYRGMVIFLEEDNYVLPDLLHMLKYAQRSVTFIPQVDVISFGRTYAKDLDYNLLTIEAWRPPYDKGLSFNKTTWRKIVSWLSVFCMHDDISWSYSLLHLFSRFPKGYAEMAACMAPRVLSTGMFPSGKKAVEVIWKRLEYSKLYPESVSAVMLFSQHGRVVRKTRLPPGSGGWNDLRDHLLCLDPLMSTITDPTEDESTTTSPVFVT